VKADRGDSGFDLGLRRPEGDPALENDLSPPPAAYPGRWVHLLFTPYPFGEIMDKELLCRKMSFADIFSASIRLFNSQMGLVLLLILCLEIPFNFINTIIPYSLLVVKYGKTFTTSLSTLMAFLSASGGLVTFIGIAYIVENSIEAKAVSLAETFRFGFYRFWDALWVNILVSAIMLGFTALFVVLVVWGVPYILASIFLLVMIVIFWVHYLFAGIIVILRNVKGKAALDFSKKLVEGQWRRVFSIQFATVILVTGIAFPLYLITQLVPDIKPLSTFIYLTISNVIGTIAMIMLVILFLNLESAKDFQKSS
jgi:hypothetical protein